ncbi:hypothetical protein M2480_000581 [Parabacteroides sp. PFB2-12]|nr:hypothetical protein [Parabacteroides sp. PM6-13]MDH6389616.1 hypothetical protein [Parabacteroides sp. PFB2-12]
MKYQVIRIILYMIFKVFSPVYLFMETERLNLVILRLK